MCSNFPPIKTTQRSPLIPFKYKVKMTVHKDNNDVTILESLFIARHRIPTPTTQILPKTQIGHEGRVSEDPSLRPLCLFTPKQQHHNYFRQQAGVTSNTVTSGPVLCFNMRNRQHFANNGIAEQQHPLIVSVMRPMISHSGRMVNYLPNVLFSPQFVNSSIFFFFIL